MYGVMISSVIPAFNVPMVAMAAMAKASAAELRRSSFS